ncbi:MAG: NAD(P)H-dependent oxidoreductase [Sedimentisphaerales bacterium]|nr:NAD(P)H-dependent oxidoreductase [Sedimentisphaerales bacterium]
MSTLLYIQASPRDNRSKSTLVAEAMVNAYKQENPNDQVVTLNLFKMDLPEFNGPALETKYAILHGQNPTTPQKEAWKKVEWIIEQFKKADRYVLSTPMWNFGIPYRLKHYFDILIQPGYTFSFDSETGYKGLVTGKPIAVVYARGGSYAPGTATASYDMQKPYVELALQFIGFTSIHSIVVEPTLHGSSQEQTLVIEKAIKQAGRIASELARQPVIH